MAKKRSRTGQAAEAPAPAARVRFPRAGFLALLASALAAKTAVLVQIANHPLLQPYGDIDSGVYARLAGRILGGDLLLRGEGPVPYFVSPLYAYFLAACGASWPAARIVQILLGTAAVALVFFAARRLFGERAALIAGALYALAGVVTFHEVLILQAALDPFLTALALFLLADALNHDGVSSKVIGAGLGRWLATGVSFGLLALNRPNALLCVVAIAVAFAVFALKETSLRSFLPALALLVGAGLAIAPVTLRNLVVSHEFVLISSHGGLNFFVGNGPGADGVYRQIPGITPDIGGQAQDAKKVAEAAESRPLSSREISAHFAREAWSWIKGSPRAALLLFLRKISLVLSSDEAPLNFSFPWYRERSSVLKLLAVGPGLLVPLAGAGLVLAWLGSSGAARRARLVWATFVPAYVVAVAAFFVATRYRLPLLVALAPLAGAAFVEARAALKAGKARALAVAAGAAVLLGWVSLRPTGLYDGAADEDMHWALYLIEKGEAEEAARVAQAAETRHPDPGTLWFRIGRSWLAVKRYADAVAALEKAAAFEHHPPETPLALAAALEGRGLERVLARDVAGGLPDLERAAALSPEDPIVLLNLATALAEEGEIGRARELARKALALRPGYEKAENLLRALK